MKGSSLRLAWRHLIKNIASAGLNIAGLAIGITCCLLATIFISNELAYDRHQHAPHEIYRFVTERLNDDGSTTSTAITPPAIANVLAHDAGAVKAVTRIFPGWGNRFYVRRPQNGGALQPQQVISATEQHVFHVDESFFDVFSASFIQGNSKIALAEAHSVVLTESNAKKYFGNENPVGQTLLVDDWKPCKVTAVINDVPANSHFHYDFLVPLKRFMDVNPNPDWNWNSFYTYFRISNAERVHEVESIVGNAALAQASNKLVRFYTQPLTAIHLRSHLQDELSANGDERYLYIFATISFFLFLVTCINSTQLITAYSLSRAKEMSIRKISGATNSSLIWQFVSESLVTILIAVAISLVLAQLALPLFNQITGKSLVLFSVQNISLVPVLVGCVFVIAIVCGIPPSLQLLKMSVPEVLKGKMRHGGNAFSPNKILLTAQFVIAATLITCTLLVYEQTTFMKKANPGLNKEQVLFVQDTYALDSSTATALRETLRQVPGVLQVAATDGDPVDNHWTKMITNPHTQQQQLIHFLTVEPAFFDVLEIPVIEGSRFNESSDKEQVNIILNETAVKQLNISAPVAGQKVKWKTNPLTGQVIYATISGVMKDFHFASMRENIAPFVLVNNANRKWNYAIRISGAAQAETIRRLQVKWNGLISSRPFQFFFLDTSYERLYRSEETYRQLFSLITVLCVITACLGLFGICAFILRQRLKETSVRKLLGASMAQLFIVLTRDLLRMIIIASLLSLPVAWWLANSWLNNFAYRIKIDWPAFLIADTFLISAALLTVSTQVLRAANVNPVKHLGEG